MLVAKHKGSSSTPLLFWIETKKSLGMAEDGKQGKMGSKPEVDVRLVTQVLSALGNIAETALTLAQFLPLLSLSCQKRLASFLASHNASFLYVHRHQVNGIINISEMSN